MELIQIDVGYIGKERFDELIHIPISAGAEQAVDLKLLMLVCPVASVF